MWNACPLRLLIAGSNVLGSLLQPILLHYHGAIVDSKCVFDPVVQGFGAPDGLETRVSDGILEVCVESHPGHCCKRGHILLLIFASYVTVDIVQ